MPKPSVIPLGRNEIPILYEDRSVFAIDKPAGWMLVPSHWDRTGRNLQLALDSSVRGGDFWAKSRNLRFLRYVHRLDAETTGVLLFARSAGGVPVYSRLFEGRQMQKFYFASVAGAPKSGRWVENAPIGPDPAQEGRMRVDARQGKEAETEFTVLESGPRGTLLLAKPLTGRTHQIRVHLAHAGLPVTGDEAYGAGAGASAEFPLGLRAAGLEYADPFTRKTVRIRARVEPFARAHGFAMPEEELRRAMWPPEARENKPNRPAGFSV
jgi:RluA family pseudouridine synthase